MEQNTPRLTDAQVRRIWEISGYPKDQFEEELRRMGLIAEPVDPLLVEARKQAADYYMDDHEPECAAACLEGGRDDYPLVQVALAALRRGRELAKPLTREMVREALLNVGGIWVNDQDKELHAALVEQMK